MLLLVWTGIFLNELAIARDEESRLLVYPPHVSLTGLEARQQLLIQERTAAGYPGRNLQDGWTIEVMDPEIARWENSQLRPLKNGETHLVVRWNDQQATVPVRVKGCEQPHVWSFRNHVQSVLTKAGCNSGPCHGAAAGQNGFKLSLRGYDPEADYFAITRQMRGRRIAPHAPAESLFLTKPTGVVPHKGGIRLDPDSLEYRVLVEWLAQGYPPPAENDPRLKNLSLHPPHVLLEPGNKQPIIVIATFTDGHQEDVTRWAKFTSSDHSVATIDDTGCAYVSGPGQSTISAWYLAQNATANISVAFPNQHFQTIPNQGSNPIDHYIVDKLNRLQIPPSPLCDDATFLRRVSLDLIGMLPTADEVRHFIQSSDPNKRSKLVDRLMSRPEFVDHWTYRWSDLFLITSERLRPAALKAFHLWIRNHVERNTPWDVLTREILLALGSTIENGAANFYALHQDPLDMAETVSMAFLGMSINCARCHDHPLEKWTNDDYYGMVSLFARVRGKGWGGDYRTGDGNRIIYLATHGEVLQPRTGRPQPPRPLDGDPVYVGEDSDSDRREALLMWMLKDNNPYYRRAIVNRLWAHFMGRGLVDKVDDLRLTNPPTHPELHDELAHLLTDHQYDLKWLMRLIVTSDTYQRSADPVPGNEKDQRFYSHFYPRRLSAEILLDAYSQVTEVPTPFKDYPVGTRALQLPDSHVASYFLDAFGRPHRLITCTCERSDEPSMTQVLHLTNGNTLREKLIGPENKLSRILHEQWAAPQIIEDLFLSSLSRWPTDHERNLFLHAIQESSPEELRAVLEDIYWSVLTSREFLLQH